MVRVCAFFAALLLYALFSAPTPDRIGIVEVLVMAGLLAGAGIGGLMQAAGARFESSPPRWMLPARVLLIFGFTVPLITSLLHEHAPGLILRDVIPFLFLLLPLFFTPTFLEQAQVQRWLPYTLCLMGFIFVVRVMAIVWSDISDGQLAIGSLADAHNLVNAPTVLFAALFLTGMGGLKLIDAKNATDLLIGCVAFAAALILLAGMAGVAQRAHIGAWLLTVIFWLGLFAIKRPRAFGRVIAVLTVFIILLWPVMTEMLQGLAQKTSVVGLNNRVEEAQVVWESFRDRPLALIFGQGWGATIISPAVGPNPVNYTHNLVTMYFLKGGLLGLGLVLTYLWALGTGIWRILWTQPVAALALAAPFLIDICLYASFKSLDFGLLLVLLTLWTRWVPTPR